MNRKHQPLKIARRDMLGLSASAAAAGLLGLYPGRVEANSDTSTASTGPGHVVKIHMPGMRGVSFPHAAAARIMIDKAVTTLTGESDPGRAWLNFVKPTDKVGLKINCLGTRMVSSMVEVVYAVAEAIRDAGVPDANIVIFDMFASNMMGGRYTVKTNPNRMRVLAHKDSGYQKSWIHTGDARVKFSDIMLWTDTIINIPPIKDHDLAGVTCCMKNVTFGTVEKPHINHNIINEAISHIWALEEIRSRVKLNIIDGSTVLHDGGPKYNRAALVPHECIYATTDPVAMDAIAYELIELLRAEKGLRTLADVRRPPTYLEMSEDLGIGVCDRARIRLETVDLPRYLGPSV